jgi:hypothetical protein
MKHLKKFENFYLNDQNMENDPEGDLEDIDRDEFQGLVSDEEDCEPCNDDDEEDDRVWGDEYERPLEEKKSSKVPKDKDKVSKDKEDSDSGLTAKQKKLPPALQKAILKRMKSKK